MRTVVKEKQSTSGGMIRPTAALGVRMVRAESSMSSARLLEASLATWEIRRPGRVPPFAVFKISLLHWHFDLNELYEWVVFRRFSEFATLHAAMRADPRIGDELVPALPSKAKGMSAALMSKHLSSSFLLARSTQLNNYLHSLLALPALQYCGTESLPPALLSFLEVRPGRVDPLLAKSNQENRATYEAAVTAKRKMEEHVAAGVALPASRMLVSSGVPASASDGVPVVASAPPAPFARDRRRESKSLGGVASFGNGIGECDSAQRAALRISRRPPPRLSAGSLVAPAALLSIAEVSSGRGADAGADAGVKGSAADAAYVGAGADAGAGAGEADAESEESVLSSSIDAAGPRSQQVLVLLGGPLTIDGHPGTWLKERLDVGAQIFKGWISRNVKDAYLITTGGDCRGLGTPEAEVMKTYLVEKHGIPFRRILTDCQAKDTIQNALLVAPLCVRLGIRAITVITSDFHLPRSKFYFDQIFDAYGGDAHFDITYAGVEDRLAEKERRDRDRKERLLIVRSTPLLRDGGAEVQCCD